MPETPGSTLSVAALIAEREAQRRREQEAEAQMRRQKEEEIVEFRERLEAFQLTDDRVQAVLVRIRRAFERGETELMLTSFPSSFCTDDGRAIINFGAPPIVKPDKDAPPPSEPDWLATLPKGARPIYEYWKQNLEPGGFHFTARIIDYPGGKPGDVGLFFSWPKSAMEG